MPEGESAISHLECALEGDRYEAGVLQGLSKAMKPLLVKYDYEKAKKTLTRAALAARPNTMWKWREILPVTKTENCVYLGEECVPAQLPHTDPTRVPWEPSRAWPVHLRGLVTAACVVGHTRAHSNSPQLSRWMVFCGEPSHEEKAFVYI